MVQLKKPLHSELENKKKFIAKAKKKEKKKIRLTVPLNENWHFWRGKSITFCTFLEPATTTPGWKRREFFKEGLYQSYQNYLDKLNLNLFSALMCQVDFYTALANENSTLNKRVRRLWGHIIP